jgi:hypothetical protein
MTLVGHTNILVKANEVSNGCVLNVDGAARRAILTVDFGTAECSPTLPNPHPTVTLDQQNNLLSFSNQNGTEMTINHGEAFLDISIILSDCDDIVTIASTFQTPNASSVEISGRGGNDTITIGVVGQKFEEIIVGNIIIDAGTGSNNSLEIIDDSDKNKNEQLRIRQLTGLHADPANVDDPIKSIQFSNIQILTIDLSAGENHLDVVSTPIGATTTITAGNQNDEVFVENTGGPLFLFMKAGVDEVTVNHTEGELHIDMKAGDDMVLVHNASGGLYISTDNGTDSVTVHESHGKVEIATKDGPDTVTIGNIYNGNLIVDAGDAPLGEADTVKVQSVDGNVDVDTGTGSDIVEVNSTSGYAEISTREGSDTVDLGAIGGYLIVDMGNAIESDILTVESTGSFTNITSGSGADFVKVFRTGGDTDIETGDETDIVELYSVGGNLALDSGEGKDIISLYGMDYGFVGVILGQGGNDELNVDGRPFDGSRGNRFDGTTLRWSGGMDNDTINTYFTSAGVSNLDIFQDLNGTNELNVECSDYACYVLSRENFLANIHNSSGDFDHAERINIEREWKDVDGTYIWDPTAKISTVFLALNGGLNEVFFDDTMASIAVAGGNETDGR